MRFTEEDGLSGRFSKQEDFILGLALAVETLEIFLGLDCIVNRSSSLSLATYLRFPTGIGGGQLDMSKTGRSSDSNSSELI